MGLSRSPYRVGVPRRNGPSDDCDLPPAHPVVLSRCHAAAARRRRRGDGGELRAVEALGAQTDGGTGSTELD